MTAAQRGHITRGRVIEAIRAYHAEHGISPSVRELCEAVGVTSSSSVHKHLTALRRKGAISYRDGLPRTIRILSLPEGVHES